MPKSVSLIYNKEIWISDGCEAIGGSFTAAGVWDKSSIEKTYECLKDKKEAVLLDVGANTGSFSLIAKFIPGLTVYAFEPFDEAYKLLCDNIQLNELTGQVRAFNLACGDLRKTENLKCCSGIHSGMSCMGPNFKWDLGYVEKKVDVHTLDSIVEREGIKQVDFIKIDTEGCELFVLRGAENTLKKFKPVILAECVERRTTNFGYHPEEIIKFLKSVNYTNIENFSEVDILAL